MANNIVTASFGAQKKVTTRTVYQYDYGMLLKVVGLELPEYYEIHFCNVNDTETIAKDSNPDGVLIPNEMLKAGKSIIAYIFIHTGDNDGETVAQITIPVIGRPRVAELTGLPNDPLSPVDM